MMSLRLFILLSIVFFSSFHANAQEKKLECNLVNLYKLTVDQSPTLQRQNIQYWISEAEKQLATSIFDHQLFSDLSINGSSVNLFDLDPRNEIVDGIINTNSLSISSGLQKMLRSGMTTSASLNYSRIGDNIPYNNYNEQVGSFFHDNNTSVTLAINQPLLRGRGRYITTANEKIAGIGIESQQSNTQFVASGEIYNMLITYWQYLGAAKSFEIYQTNEKRVRKVLNVTQDLVKAEKKPASELIQIQADLKDKERQTIAAQQQVFSARQNLGRAVGLNTLESELLGTPTNEFPSIEDIPSDLNLKTLLEIAHSNRMDLKALKKSLEALSIYVDVAENNLKPQLDLTASATYGGVHAGNELHRFLTALGQREGRNYQVGVGISYLFPIQNNAADANLLSSQLQYTDREVQLNNQIRNIEVNVSIAYNNLLNSIDALKKSKQSLAYYEEVFENEQYKFQAGLTTLLNLILFQERLTFAQLDYLNHQQQFALAIGNLRYETGTIQFDKSTTWDLNKPEVFYTLPK